MTSAMQKHKQLETIFPPLNYYNIICPLRTKDLNVLQIFGRAWRLTPDGGRHSDLNLSFIIILESIYKYLFYADT